MPSHIFTRLCSWGSRWLGDIQNPDVPLLAVVLAEQVGSGSSADIKLLESASFEGLLLPSLDPAYVMSEQVLAHV